MVLPVGVISVVDKINYDGEVDYYTQEIRKCVDSLYMGRLHTNKHVDEKGKQAIINRLRFILGEIGDICSEAEL